MATQQNCLRACTTMPTCRATWRPRGKFYEDIIGLPLVATWCEKDELFGKERTYCHCFFGLGDGGALAFFQFADEEDRNVRAQDAALAVPSHRAERRRGDAGRHREARSRPPATEPQSYVLEHGYCRSVYVDRPQWHDLEFTLDHPEADKINAIRAGDAHCELKRWLAGDHTLQQHVPLGHGTTCCDSTDRILTTHVGSLPRSQAVTDVLFAREGNGADAARRRRRSSPMPSSRVVRKQVEAGVDVVSDGEMGKISYATYIEDRFTGFDGDTPREPGQDLVDIRACWRSWRSWVHGEVPPAALRRRNPRQGPRAACRRTSRNLKRGHCRRRSRAKASSTRPHPA